MNLSTAVIAQRVVKVNKTFCCIAGFYHNQGQYGFSTKTKAGEETRLS